VVVDFNSNQGKILMSVDPVSPMTVDSIVGSDEPDDDVQNTVPNSYLQLRPAYPNINEKLAIVLREVGRNIVAYKANEAIIWSYLVGDEYYMVVSSDSEGFKDLQRMMDCCELARSYGGHGYSGVGIKGAAIVMAPADNMIGMGLVSRCIDGKTEYVYMKGEYGFFTLEANPLKFVNEFKKALGSQSSEVDKFTVHNIFRASGYRAKLKEDSAAPRGVISFGNLRYAIDATPEIFEKVNFKVFETPVGAKVDQVVDGKVVGPPIFVTSLADIIEKRVKLSNLHASRREVNEVMPHFDFENLYSIRVEVIEVRDVVLDLGDAYKTQVTFDGSLKIVWYAGYYRTWSYLQPLKDPKGFGYDLKDWVSFHVDALNTLTTLTFDIDNPTFKMPGKNLNRVKEDPIYFSSEDTPGFMMDLDLPICRRTLTKEQMGPVMADFPVWDGGKYVAEDKTKPFVQLAFKMTHIHSIKRLTYKDNDNINVPITLHTMQQIAGRVNDFLITESRYVARKVVNAIIEKARYQTDLFDELKKFHQTLFPVSDLSEFLPLEGDDGGAKGKPDRIPILQVYIEQGKSKWVRLGGLLSPDWARKVKFFNPVTKDFMTGKIEPDDESCTIKSLGRGMYNLAICKLKNIDEDGADVLITDREDYNRDSLPKRLIYVKIGLKLYRVVPNTDIETIESNGGKGGSKPGPKKAPESVYCDYPDYPDMIACFQPSNKSFKLNKCNHWIEKIYGFRGLENELIKEATELFYYMRESTLIYMRSGLNFQAMEMDDADKVATIVKNYMSIQNYAISIHLESLLAPDTDLNGTIKKDGTPWKVGLIDKIASIKQKSTPVTPQVSPQEHSHE
jgi:hypothetical protein